PMPAINLRIGETASTQEGFGRIMTELGRDGGAFARRIVTCSPDVTVSTNLGGWVNHAGVFARRARPDVFREQHLQSAQKWLRTPAGRHIELGIAENNLFLLLASLGLAEPLFDTRLLPVGTLYDPFVARGLDALNHACYQDARFMLAATPSGITLAPEGGAHQSVIEPLIGMGQPGLTYFEPAFVDEMQAAMAWGFDHMQAADGGSVYLRLSTRAIVQPQRSLTDALRAAIVAGGYWLRPPQAGGELVVVAMGAALPEAIAAVAQLGERNPRVGLLAVTSPEPALCRLAGARPPLACRPAAGGFGPRRDAGQRARRPSTDAGVARRRARPTDQAARRDAVRTVGRHSRSLPRLRHRRGGDRRRCARW
ncbi:MAG: hypothetical protein ACREES_11550, partial [Stellaceae bacterium]